MSPGRVLVAGTGRVAAGTGRLGESPLDSRCGQALESGEEGLAFPTHNIMSRLHNQNSSVKQKTAKNHTEINRSEKSLWILFGGTQTKWLLGN
jgi:hypothetical protein